MAALLPADAGNAWDQKCRRRAVPRLQYTRIKKCLYAQMGTACVIHMRHIRQQSIMLRNKLSTSLRNMDDCTV